MPGMDTISVPYMPKSSSFFPKLVDPKTMIAKKTDLLNNLFGGLGPVDTPIGSPPAFSKYPTGFASSKPILFAASSDPTTQELKESIATENPISKDQSKRAAVSPTSSKYDTPKVSSFYPFTAPFSPFAGGFSPFAPKFGPSTGGFPFAGFPPQFGPSFYGSDGTSSRRRRSVVDTENTKAVGPAPAYPGLAPISEEPETIESKLLKLLDPSITPKETLTGMFGPLSPFSPYAAPAVDPMTMISKKMAFLDSLFKSLATTASPIDPKDSMIELPIPKSTIVPPGFWAPSSIIPGPTEYTDKVSDFLDTLFSSLALNKTGTAPGFGGKTVSARSIAEDTPQDKTIVSRSIEDIKTIAAAKDSIVDSILSELSDLKTDMIATFNDYMIYQKTLPVSATGKKIKPFAAFFAAPTADPTIPFKQRMAVLSQVFDMLTEIQKNITSVLQEAIIASTDAPIAADTRVENFPAKINEFDYGYSTPYSNSVGVLNTTLFDAIKARLAALDSAVGTGFNKPIVSADLQGKEIFIVRIFLRVCYFLGRLSS